MYSLYIDTCYYLTIGLFDKEKNPIDFFQMRETKNAAYIHDFLFNFLEKNNVETNDVTEFYSVSGPGSYTGIRLSFVFTEVLEILGKKSFSFYLFDVPKFLGINEYLWVGNAFKSEVFLYHYKDGEVSQGLLKTEIAGKKIRSLSCPSYTHFEDSLPEGLTAEIDFEETSKLIIDNSKKILSMNISKEKPFYYRSIDQEFKKSFIELRG